MVFATFLVGCVPETKFKRWLNDKAFKMSFRILARSLSLVLTTHNQEYKPRTGGVCVANHTTPVDVVILSTESSFSLVSYSVTGGRHRERKTIHTYIISVISQSCASRSVSVVLH